MRNAEFLAPLTGTVKRKKFCVYDIESKDGESLTKAGFTRPFACGFFDGRTYHEFRDEPHLRSRKHGKGCPAKGKDLPESNERHCPTCGWKMWHIMLGGCLDKFLSIFLTKKYKGYHCYAHNGGNFDHLFLLAWLRNHEDEYGFEIIPVASSIQKLTVWRLPDEPDDRPTEVWHFLDSFKLLPMRLDKAAKTFGLEGKVQHDLNLHEDDPTWAEYLKADCIQLYHVLTKTHDLVENILGGEVGLTTPATSMKLYRRRFLGRGDCPNRIPRHIHFPECANKPIGQRSNPDGSTCTGCGHEWIRQAYYGGRTEMFRAHGKKLRYYDINSSYVAAMRESMPAGDRTIAFGRVSWEMHKGNVGFAECTVHIPEGCEVPPLPWRAPSGKLIFPVGTFSGVWDTEELKLLEDPSVNGHIVDVRRVVWFRRKHLFVDMVDTLWALRDKTRADYDEGLSALAKLMGNSLYGKFGMRQDRTTVVLTQNEHKPEQCFLCRKECVANQLCDACIGSKPASADPDCDVWYQKKHMDADYIIPQIAAHITTLARVRIWRYMRQAVDLGGRLYYTDTDSVITDVDMPNSLELGGLKNEYPGVELSGAFLQPKVYMIEQEEPFEGEHLASCADKKCTGCSASKVTMKGFPKSLRTKESLERLQAGETLTYDNLEKVRTLARLRFDRSPAMKIVKKSFKGTYDKRVLHDDGTTSAHVLGTELHAAAEE